VRGWWSRNAPLRSGGAPTPDEEYLIYQTVVGAWPLERGRLRDYVTKAMREAKVATGWTAPDEAHEAAVMAFVDGLYASARFVSDVEDLVHRVAPIGEAHALGQTLLKLTSPGVPDVYQGDELWDLALVDPDNRRPVDWDLRRRLMDDELAADAAPRRATAKMHLIRRALDLRARRAEAFAGGYRPLEAGPQAFAYARGDQVIAATPVRVDGDGSVLRIPPDLQGPWRNVLTGEDVPLHSSARVGDLAGPLPVALLERA